MGNQNGYTTAELLISVIAIVCCLGGVGWLMNFQNIFQYGWPSKELIVSIVGVFFPPLGAITGWVW